jgi:hypothetical protein
MFTESNQNNQQTMATRSRIAIQHEDGSISSIYCHYDGHPQHHLPILKEHYSTPEKVKQLIELGNLSFLSERIEPTGPHSFDQPRFDTCLAYGRDRGEKGQEAVQHKDLKDFEHFARQGWAEWLYIFGQDGNWWAIDAA